MNFPNSQSNPAGAIPVWLAPAPGQQSSNLTTDTGVLLYTGAGFLTGISVNTAGTGSTVKVYDGTDDTGTLLGTWATTAQGNLPIPGGGLNFAIGLFVVPTGSPAANLTITWVEG